MCLREYKRGTNIPLFLIEKILPQAKKIGYQNISLTGGEPALHPEFENIVKMIVDNGFNFSFISNGSMLKKYEFTVTKYKKNLQMATFSLDGSSSIINDDIRSKGAFACTCKTIKFFVKKKIPVSISICLNKKNKNDINNMYKLALELKVKTLIFTSTIKTNFNKSLVLSDLEKMIVLNDISKRAIISPIRTLVMSALLTKKGVNFCNGINDLSTLAINPFGKAIFCCDTVREGKVIGDLQKEDFYQIYSRYLRAVFKLKQLRLEILKNDKIPKGFYSCEFCNGIDSKTLYH